MKVEKRRDYYVKVDPSENCWNYYHKRREQATYDQAKRLLAEVKRHIDAGSIDIEGGDKYFICSHCETEWDADEDTGEPFCCGKAQDEWNALRVITGADRRE